MPLPNEPGLDRQNIMDYRFSAPITNDFNTTIGRIDYRFTDNQSIFGRFNVQDDTINGAPHSRDRYLPHRTWRTTSGSPWVTTTR